jgi:hypothetical protein
VSFKRKNVLLFAGQIGEEPELYHQSEHHRKAEAQVIKKNRPGGRRGRT